MERDSGSGYASKAKNDDEQHAIRARPKFYFAQIEFEILGLTARRILRPADVATVVALLRYADYGSKKGNAKFAPTGQQIAEALGVNKDTLWPSLSRLERAGVIVRKRESGARTTIDVLPPDEWTPQLVETPTDGRRNFRPGGKFRPGTNPAENFGQGSAENFGQGSAENFGQGSAENFGQHILEPPKVAESLRDSKNLPPSSDDGSTRDFKLEDEEPAIKRKAKKKPAAVDPRVAPTIVAFDLAHKKARDGQPYVVKGGRDGAMLKRLPPEYTPEILVAMVASYFADDSTWWAETRSREIPSFVAWLSSPAGGIAFADAKAGKRVVAEPVKPALPPIFRTDRDGKVHKLYPVEQ